MHIVTMPEVFLIDGSTTRRFSFSAKEKSPSDLWEELSTLPDVVAVLLAPAGATVLDGALRAHSAMKSANRSAAFGQLRSRLDETLAPPSRADFVRYGRSASGCLLVSLGLAAELSERLKSRVWDPYWASDLAAEVMELCEPLATGHIFLDLTDVTDRPEPIGMLLPIRRAGSSAFIETAPTIVVYSACDASTLLYFDAFSRCDGLNLRFLRPSQPLTDLSWLCSASAVIFIRSLETHVLSGVFELLKILGIPVFWFVDDDFVALADEYASLDFYKSQALHAQIERLDGLLVSTPEMKKAMSRRFGRTAEKISVLPPRIAPSWPGPPDKRNGIAVIGGAFRGGSLRVHMPRALEGLGSSTRLMANDNLRPFLHGIAAEWEPFESDFLTFLHRWRRRAPAVVLHPAGKTENIANKSAATILVAHVLGAVPVVADEPAYKGWDETSGVLKLHDDDWIVPLQRALDPSRALEFHARLRQALTRKGHFGAVTASDLLVLLDEPKPVDDDTFHDRLNRGLSIVGASVLKSEKKPNPRLWSRLKKSFHKRIARLTR
jgi:hypothetical protein